MLEIGKAYFFMNTRQHFVGRVVNLIDGGHTVVLDDAAWIRSAGILSHFMATGAAEEAEFVGRVSFSTDKIDAAMPWVHALFVPVPRS